VIVCMCKNVNERAIRTAIENGACSVREVGAATGAGTGCGCCRGVIAGLVALHAPGASFDRLRMSGPWDVVAANAPPRLVALSAPTEPARGSEAPPQHVAADRLS
jgi:bacterioferritin-associated ferredoxin